MAPSILDGNVKQAVPVQPNQDLQQFQLGGALYMRETDDEVHL